MKALILISFLFLVLVSGCTQPQESITSFEECVAAGYPVMESYPRQCAVPGGETFTEEIDGLELCNTSCVEKGYDVGHCMIPEEICEDDVESGNCLPGSCEKEGDCRCYCKYEIPPEER